MIRGNRGGRPYTQFAVADPINAMVLRLLDANANRAREALRVLEDYARFVLDNADLSGHLKHLRHDLTSALEPFLPAAILHRDTPGDVGTSIKTDAEFQREKIGDVVTAAGKRLGEALRSLAEFAKTFNSATAVALEHLRYRFYDIEQAIARTLRPANLFAAVRLYVLITESACKLPWLETARAVIAGGVDALQLREKNLESGELLKRARVLAKLCKEHGVLLIINDRPDIAVLSDADGVHVGQGDLPVTEARKIVGHERIVGVSTHEIAHARQAVLDGADYIGVGPIFRSSTKQRDWAEIPGLAFARQIAQSIKIPAMAIAGINQENLDHVQSTGLTAIAVTAAVTSSDDPEKQTRWFKQRLGN